MLYRISERFSYFSDLLSVVTGFLLTEARAPRSPQVQMDETPPVMDEAAEAKKVYGGRGLQDEFSIPLKWMDSVQNQGF